MRALRRTAARDPKPVPRRLPGAQPFSDTTHPASSPALPSGKSLDLHAGAFPFGLRAPGPMLRQLAQRIPVRIHIDEVPEGVVLAAGMTATVQINPQLRRLPE
jgi:hypothetical protein